MKKRFLLLMLFVALLAPWAVKGQNTVYQKVTQLSDVTSTGKYILVYPNTTSTVRLALTTPTSTSSTYIGVSYTNTNVTNDEIQTSDVQSINNAAYLTISGTAGDSQITGATIQNQNNYQFKARTTSQLQWNTSGHSNWVIEFVNGNLRIYRIPDGSTTKYYVTGGTGGFNLNATENAGSIVLYKETEATNYPAPKNLTVTSKTAHEATLTWASPSENLTGYAYQYKKTADESWSTLVEVGSSVLTCTIEELDAATSYDFRVKAIYENDPEINFATTTFTTESSCPAPTNLEFTLTPGNGSRVTLNWTENGEATSWQLCLNGDEENLIAMNTNPFTYDGCTPEIVNTAKVRAYCDATDQSDWSNTVSFTPTSTYTITLNDNTNTNSYVPIYGSYIDYGTRSQFIIPASALSEIQWATLSKLTFYNATASVDFGTREFAVYMKEVNYTTFETAACEDWNSMSEVRSSGTISISNNQMVLTLTAPYLYKGGNLMIGIQQTAFSSSTKSLSWYGVTQTSGTYTAIYNNANSSHVWSTTYSRQTFLPKVTIDYTPGEEPSCLPVTLGDYTATSSTATINWTSNGEETSWNVRWRINGSSDAYNTAVATSNSYEITGLNGMTTYEYGVQAICEELSDWTNSTLMTECGAKSLTYFYGFEDATDYDNCWNKDNIHSSTGIYNYSARTGSNCFRFYHSTSNDPQTLISPELITTSKGVRVELYHRTQYSGSYYEQKFKVGYSTTSTGVENFTWDDVVTTTSNTYTLYQHDFGVDGIKYIAIQYIYDKAYDLYIDDITLSEAPSCFQPTGLTASDVTSATVSLSWTPGSVGQDHWDIYYSTSSTAPTSTTILDETNSRININQNPYILTGLEANTTYYVWVRGNCGGGDVSEWSDVEDFQTECNAYPIPYEYGFEEDEAEDMDCWTMTNCYSGTGRTTTDKRTGSYSFGFNRSSLYDPQYLITPELSGTSAGVHIEFYYKHSANTCNFQVGHSTTTKDVASAFTWSEEVSNPSSSYVYFEYDFPENTKYICIRYNATSWTSLYIDDIKITAIPTCKKPTGLTASEATSSTVNLSWTPGSVGQDHWDIYYSTNSTAPTSTTVLDETNSRINIDENPYLLTGLEGFTTYYVWVRGNCGGGDVSGWSEGTNFQTECAAYPIPYDYGFEDAHDMNCWKMKETSGTTGRTSGNGHNSSSYCFQFYYGGYDTQYLITPELSGASEGVHVEFYYKRNSNTSASTFQVGYSTTTDDVESFTWNEATGNPSTTYQLFEEDFKYDIKYIAIKFSATAYNYLYIDDISLSVAPACSRPKYVTASSMTTHTAQLGWTAGYSDQDHWDIYYSTSNTVPTGETVPSIENTGNNPQELTGLLKNTMYYAWVRGNCGGSVSEWSKLEYSFTTLDLIAPDGLLATNITANSATVSWNAVATNDNHASYELYYSTSSSTPSDTPETGDNYITGIAETSYTLDNVLDEATTYYVWVRDNCGSDGNTAWSSPINFPTNQTPVVIDDTHPFFDDFETENKWLLINKNQTNQWAWGTAAHNGEGSTKAIYISNDGGESHYYNISNTSVSFATKCFTISEGTYSFSYDWISNGEHGSWDEYDFMRVVLAPSTVSLSAGTTPSGLTKNTVPEGWIALDGGSQLNNSDEWQTKRINDVEIINGNYILVIYWVNDGGSGNQPPAAIDNFSIATMTCSTPTALHETETTSTTATLAWTKGAESQTQWEIAYKDESFDPNTDTYLTKTTNTDPTVELTGLTPATTYHAYVRAVCGEEDYSDWSAEDTFLTDCGSYTVDSEHSFTQSFDDATFQPLCWTLGAACEHGDNWTRSTAYKHSGTASAYSSYYGTVELWTPTLNIDAEYAKLSFWSYNTGASYYTGGSDDAGGLNIVKVSTDGGSSYTQIWCPESVTQSWVETTLSLADYVGQEIIIAFIHEGDNANGWYLDDVTVTAFDKVIFAGNWPTSGDMPSIDDNVYIAGDVIIENGTVAYANSITLEEGSHLIIEDGGQLIHNNAVNATLQKNITAWTTKDVGGWYFIASPVDDAEIDESFDQTIAIDLFKYDEPDAYWYSYLNNGHNLHPFTALDRGVGYLHASESQQTLEFTGEMVGTNESISLPLSYACEYTDVKGYNLMGNPFTRNLTTGDITKGGVELTTYYGINAATTGMEAKLIANEPIKPGQGFFVQVESTDANHILVFNPSKKDETVDNGYICIAAGNENNMDKAYVQIKNGNTLRKMNIANMMEVYVINNGDDYAAARVEELAGTMPVHFKAVEDGEFTITINAKNIEASTMMLFDNQTGELIDLLETPTYAFKASAEDDDNRFKLIFDFNNNYNGVDDNYVNGNFAYQNGDELFVSGDGTLQVFDVMGRFVMSKEIHGNESISVSAFETGVYMLRFVGENIMTQKIVVR